MIKILCDCCGKEGTTNIRKILSSRPIDQEMTINMSKITVDIKEFFPAVEDICDVCIRKIKNQIAYFCTDKQIENEDKAVKSNTP